MRHYFPYSLPRAKSQLVWKKVFRTSEGSLRPKSPLFKSNNMPQEVRLKFLFEFVFFTLESSLGYLIVWISARICFLYFGVFVRLFDRLDFYSYLFSFAINRRLIVWIFFFESVFLPNRILKLFVYRLSSLNFIACLVTSPQLPNSLFRASPAGGRPFSCLSK